MYTSTYSESFCLIFLSLLFHSKIFARLAFVGWGMVCLAVKQTHTGSGACKGDDSGGGDRNASSFSEKCIDLPKGSKLSGLASQ